MGLSWHVIRMLFDRFLIIGLFSLHSLFIIANIPRDVLSNKSGMVNNINLVTECQSTFEY